MQLRTVYGAQVYKHIGDDIELNDCFIILLDCVSSQAYVKIRAASSSIETGCVLQRLSCSRVRQQHPLVGAPKLYILILGNISKNMEA